MSLLKETGIAAYNQQKSMNRFEASVRVRMITCVHIVMRVHIICKYVCFCVSPKKHTYVNIMCAHPVHVCVHNITFVCTLSYYAGVVKDGHRHRAAGSQAFAPRCLERTLKPRGPLTPF